MKKYISALLDKYRSAILIAVMLCFAFVGNSQVYQQFNQYGATWKRQHITTVFGIPNDTFAIDAEHQAYPHVAFKSDSLYLWNVGLLRWTLLSSTGNSFASCEDKLIDGGHITYSGTGLKFYISPAIYRINCVIYTTTYDSVTLTTADPDDPRKDVIYLATTGVEVKTGTPAGPAAEPQMEAGQIKLTVVDIQAGASVPNITTNIIYDENGGESTVTNVGTTTDPDNTEDPYHLTKAVEFTNVDNLDAGIFTLPSTVDITTYEGISMFLRLKGVMHSTARIYVTFGNGSNWISNEVQVTMNKNSLTYQGLTVPMSLFTFTNAFVDKIRIRWYQSSPVVHPGFYLDYVHWESGVQQPGGGSTPMTIGTINSKLPSPNGAVIENNVFYNQTWSQTHDGLGSKEDKAKLDSLKYDYFFVPEGDGEELVTQVNDSTVGIKSLKAGTGVTLDVTDTTITVNSTGGATPTLQQVLDAGSTLSTPETISVGSNALGVSGTAATVSFNNSLGAIRITNSSTSALSIASTNAGTSNFFSRDASSDAFPVASFKNTTSGTNTSARVFSLGRATTGTPGDGLASELFFSLETAGTGASEDVTSGRIINKFSTVDHPTRTTQWDINGIDNASEETFMNIQKDLVRINNNADTLATKAYARSLAAGGGYTDADARAAISLTTTGSSGAATYNSGTGVLNVPDYSSGTSIWNGTVIGTSFSATSTTISSAALQWTFTGSSPATFTLPARTSSVNQFYTIKNIGSADLTVAADGTDDIFTTTSVSSLTVVPGGSVMITGAANGTSDLWTALFHTTGSAPIDTAYLRRAGNGTQIAYTDNDTLFLKDLIGEDFITVDTKTDSTTRVRLDTASAGLKSYIAANSSGGSTISVSSSWFVDTLKINGAAASWSTRPDVIYDEFLSAQNTASGSFNTSELAIGTGTDASIGNTLGSIPSTWHGVMVFQTGSTATGLAAIATTSTTQARLYVDTTKKYRFETVVRLPVLSAAADSFRVTAGFTVYTTNYTVASNDIHFRYSHGHNSGAWTCYNNNTGGSGQATNTAVTVAANTDYKLGIEFDGEQILFYINDVLEATHTTALPAQGSSMLFPVVAITKTGGTTGTTNMFMYADWIKYRKL